MITLQNYEEFFVHYLDGELASDEVAEVNSFLLKYPHLKADLDAFRATILHVDEQLVFPKKEFLKKGITLANYENYFISNVEGILSSEEKNALADFIFEHPELQREYNAFYATKLIAVSQVVFPNKDSLRKREGGRVVPLYIRYVLMAAVAASLILIVMMKGFQWQQTPETPSLAQQHSSQTNSIAEQQASKKNEIGVNENAVKVDDQTSALALNQQSASVAKNASHNEFRKKEKRNFPTPGNQLYADASQFLSADTQSNSVAAETRGTTEMNKLGNGVLPISYQSRFKKAQYREITASNVASEAKPVKFSSVATALGSKLLKLSGREDYLKGSSAFADNKSKDEKRPIEFSVKGEKFDFYHKFFKKRARNNSTR